MGRAEFDELGKSLVVLLQELQGTKSLFICQWRAKCSRSRMRKLYFWVFGALRSEGEMTCSLLMLSARCHRIRGICRISSVILSLYEYQLNEKDNDGRVWYTSITGDFSMPYSRMFTESTASDGARDLKMRLCASVSGARGKRTITSG